MFVKPSFVIALPAALEKKIFSLLFKPNNQLNSPVINKLKLVARMSLKKDSGKISVGAMLAKADAPVMAKQGLSTLTIQFLTGSPKSLRSQKTRPIAPNMDIITKATPKLAGG